MILLVHVAYALSSLLLKLTNHVACTRNAEKKRFHQQRPCTFTSLQLIWSDSFIHGRGKTKRIGDNAPIKVLLLFIRSMDKSFDLKWISAHRQLTPKQLFGMFNIILLNEKKSTPDTIQNDRFCIKSKTVVNEKFYNERQYLCSSLAPNLSDQTCWNSNETESIMQPTYELTSRSCSTKFKVFNVYFILNHYCLTTSFALALFLVFFFSPMLCT